LKRLLTVLEKRLEKSAYVAGDDYSIADMAIWPGRASAFVMGMGLDEWPAMLGWFERIRDRPAVARAMAREDLKAPAKYIGRHQKLDDKQWSNMFGDANHAAAARD
jgi:GST-like protein